MRAFRHLTIRRKLTLIPMLTTTVTLALAGLLYLTFDFISMRRELRGDLTSLAESLGRTAEAALVFHDELSAGEILHSLTAKPNVAAAYLYTGNSRLLAQYRRGSAVPAATPEEPHVAPSVVGSLRVSRAIVIN